MRHAACCILNYFKPGNALFRGDAFSEKGQRGLLCAILLMSSFAFSQQISLRGSIAVHNSKYKTGKQQFIKDAFITARYTKPSSTDNNGNFSLQFVGTEIGTSIKLEIAKQGLEVVNRRDLEDVVLGRKRPLRIYLAKKGKLAEAQAQL